jgi:hypothetical protein
MAHGNHKRNGDESMKHDEHDELQMKVYGLYKNAPDDKAIEDALLALNSVVVLHAPAETICTGEYIEGVFGCYGCEDDYPCPTIQAIKRELS